MAKRKSSPKRRNNPYERLSPFAKLIFWILLVSPNMILLLLGNLFEPLGFGWHVAAFIVGASVAGGYANVADPEIKLSDPNSYFQNIRDLDEIRELNPIEFENLIGQLFARMGYSVETTAATGDEGIDLFVRKDGRKGVVQCKKYKGTVGAPILQDLYGAMIHNRADEAYIITTGTITLPAQQWASGKPIHLVDGITLLDWLESFQLESISEESELESNQ